MDGREPQWHERHWGLLSPELWFLDSFLDRRSGPALRSRFEDSQPGTGYSSGSQVCARFWNVRSWATGPTASRSPGRVTDLNNSRSWSDNQASQATLRTIG